MNTLKLCSFNCFSCDAKGTVIDFEACWCSCTPGEAIFILAKEYNIDYGDKSMDSITGSKAEYKEERDNKSLAKIIWDNAKPLEKRQAKEILKRREFKSLADGEAANILANIARINYYKNEEWLVFPYKKNTGEIVGLHRIRMDDLKTKRDLGDKQGIFLPGKENVPLAFVESIFNAIPLNALGHTMIMTGGTENKKAINNHIEKAKTNGKEPHIWFDRGSEEIQKKYCKEFGVKGIWWEKSRKDGFDINSLLKDSDGNFAKEIATYFAKANSTYPIPTIPQNIQSKFTLQDHSDKPIIQIIGGQLPQMVDQAEQALLLKDNQIFQQNNSLVRVITNSSPPRNVKRASQMPIITSIEVPYLVKRFAEVATWVRYDSRKKDWKPADCPKIVSEVYITCPPWKVPALEGIISAPTLRRDGTILDKPGYDQETCLLFHPGLTKFSPIAQKPTKDDAIKAVKKFRNILCGFPFVSETDFSVALSGIITTLVRRSIRTAPLHGFSAPKMGSGKSLLADVIAMIATGYPAAVMNQVDSPEEEKKRLLSVLLEGDPVICIDNVSHPLGSDALCSILTQEMWKERILGKNKTATVLTNVTFLATGNNLHFQGDLSTRALMCMLDPECEHPEERSFDVNLYHYIPEQRSQLVAAGLTILRAYHVAGRPKQSVPTFGRFEEWSDWVRSALLWLELADPGESRKRIEDSDPVRANLKALLANWYACTKKSVTLKEIVGIGKEQSNEGLYDALMEFAGEKHGEINIRKMGQKLKAIQGRIEGGMRLEQFGKRKGTILWRVRTIDKE